MSDNDGALDAETIAHLKALLARMKGEREKLDLEMARVVATIQKLERKARSIMRDGGGRRKRGDNMRTIRTLFAESPDKEFAMQDIATFTGIPLSSASIATEKLVQKQLVKKLETGLWKWAKKDEEVGF